MSRPFRDVAHLDIRPLHGVPLRLIILCSPAHAAKTLSMAAQTFL